VNRPHDRHGVGTAATVAVIIPTYNRAKLVVQALDSILNQTRRPDAVVVIDDGSTDDTASVLKRYGNRIRYLRQENSGKAAALNRAMAAVDSDYVWIMDDDDVALPDALERHLAFLAAHPEADFSYSPLYMFTGDAPPAAPSAEQLQDCAQVEGPADFFIRVMLWFPFYMQSMLTPLACYRRVGPFDEDLAFGEDYDMILRLARRFHGAKLAKPALLVREHSGARGPAHERRTAAEREAMFRRYDKKIFPKLYKTLSLDEYLPRGTAQGPLDNEQSRLARLQRACIMIRHGLYDQAFADMDMVLAERDGDMKLTRRERRMFTEMLNVGFWWQEKHPVAPSMVGGYLRERRAWTALASCAAGLWWQIVQGLRAGQNLDAWKLSLRFGRLIGFTGISGLIKHRLNHRYPRSEIS
jgi:glycosyltransferase involved in cell wall biosynthesis